MKPTKDEGGNAWKKSATYREMPLYTAEQQDELKAQVESLRSALEEIAIYKEEDNDKALTDPKFATMLWRGCVATAKHVLKNKGEK